MTLSKMSLNVVASARAIWDRTGIPAKEKCTRKLVYRLQTQYTCVYLSTQFSFNSGANILASCLAKMAAEQLRPNGSVLKAIE